MHLEDLKIKLANYKSTSKRKLNKALTAKIKYIPSQKIFYVVMYRLGVSQRYRTLANLITNIEVVNLNEFSKNNEFKLSGKTIVFEDFIDERKFDIPKGKTVEVYTRRRKEYISPTYTNNILDVLYIMDQEILLINKIE